MKAITIWQPWAGALAAGIKENETRGWATKYRGPIAIHAAGRDVFDGLKLIPVPIALKIKEALRCEWDEIPRGAIIATGELVDCVEITREFTATLSPDELALGNYKMCRYAWKLANVKKLPDPIPVKGRQGLWNWKALLLTHKGRDGWDRPVYEDEDGRLWVDVEPTVDRQPKLCTVLDNMFGGEPDTPMEYIKKYEGVPVVFLPERDTWSRRRYGNEYNVTKKAKPEAKA